jgi:hypothetical protein
MTNLNYLSGAIDASGCIGQAWELFRRNPGLYLGAGLVTLLLISCVPFVNVFLLGPVMGGFAYIVLHDMRDEPVEFGMLFKGFEKFLPLMVIGLIQAIPAIIFQIVRFAVDLTRLTGGPVTRGIDYQSGGSLPPGLTVGIVILFVGYLFFQVIWQLALIFAIPLIVENDVSIGDAIKLSLGAVFSNIGGLIVLMIFGFFVSIIGILALCFGIFVAIPVIWSANVVAYRQVFPYFDRSNFNVTPPPPTEYGGGYGQSY